MKINVEKAKGLNPCCNGIYLIITKPILKTNTIYSSSKQACRFVVLLLS